MDLDFIINENRVSWFYLKNNNQQDEKLFKEMINRIVKVSKTTDVFGEKGADNLIEKENTEQGVIFHVEQRKVPNIVKCFVDLNDIDVTINLTGINPNMELATKTISKPLNMNEVLELIPYYHPFLKKIKINDAEKIQKSL